MIPAYLSPLVNHLWQSTLCALMAGLLTLLLKRNRATVRYWLWFIASVKFLVPFSLLLSIGSHVEWRVASATAPPPLSFVMEISQPLAPSALTSRSAVPAAPGRAPAILFCLWLCGFATGVLSWLRQWRRIRITVRAASPMHLDVPIPVMSCAARMEPGVFGIRRPLLLLPEGITDGLSPAQLKAVLTHELCHVRRRDNLTAAIHMLVETIFWFHPLVWWIGVRLVEARERACDEEVLQTAGEPQVYAEGILNVCKFYLESPLACVSGVTGSNLTKRIEAIMANHRAIGLSLSKRLLLAVAAIGAVAGPVAIGMLNAPPSRAQSRATARSEFDVASVKPFKLGSQPEDRKITASHGTLMLRQQTLRECIEWAYGLKPGSEITGPVWMNSEEYDISAKAAEAATDDQLRVMLQALLAERFKLTVHYKSEQRPVYALIAGKKSPRLHEVQKEPVRGFRVDLQGGVLTYQMVTNMSRLAGMLPAFLDRPVFDRTGLTGVYEFTLRVEMDPQTRMPEIGQTFTGWGYTPGVFAAVEELGLKLVSQKGPVDVLAVDHVERPSEN